MIFVHFLGQMLRRKSEDEARGIPGRPVHGSTVVLKFLAAKVDGTDDFITELKTIVGSFALNNPKVSRIFIIRCDYLEYQRESNMPYLTI